MVAADLRKDSWLNDDTVEYGGGTPITATPSPASTTAPTPPPTIDTAVVAPPVSVVAGADSETSPSKKRRQTMRVDDGISKLIRRQTAFTGLNTSVATLRDLKDMDDEAAALADIDAAVAAMDVLGSKGDVPEEDDDYMNEAGECAR